MFTGLIEHLGSVVAHTFLDEGSRLVIETVLTEPLQVGESIAVNGVCLTALPSLDNLLQVAFDLSPETLKLTTLSTLSVGDCVNIERAMVATARFGGHYVSGHVDTTASVHAVVSYGDCVQMVIGGFLPAECRYLLPKGSITIDGVSLTINRVVEHKVYLMLVPHTLTNTIFSRSLEGQRVNVEFDYLTRIVAHQLDFMSTLDEVV